MLLLLTALTNAAASEPKLKRIEELELDELLGTVSAASGRSESVLLSPATVTVIDTDRIRLSGARSVPELLRTVPGVSVSQHAPGEYQVHMRGIGSLDAHNLVVLLDGVPLNRRLDAGIDWAALPVSVWDLDRVEVVRGPVSVIYGSNAYSGVVSLITREAASETVKGRVGGQVGVDREARTGGTVSAAAGRERTRGGWYLADQVSYDGTNSGGAVEQSAALSASQMLKARRELGETTLTARSGASVSRASGLNRLVTDVTPHETRSLYLQAALERDLTPMLTLSGWSRLQHTAIRVREEALAEAAGFTYDDTMDDDGAIGAQLAWSPAGWMSFRIGTTAGVAHVRAPYLDEILYTENSPYASGFALLDLDPTSWLRLSVGSRHDVSIQLSEKQAPFRVSLLTHWDRGSARLTWAKAYREPSYLELWALPSNGAPVAGEPLLHAPVIGGLEFGLVLAPTRRLSTQVTAFSQYSQDEVGFYDDPGVCCVFVNLEETAQFGTEVELTAALTEFVTLNVSGGNNYLIAVDGGEIALADEAASNGAVGVYGTAPAGRMEYGGWLSWRSEQRYGGGMEEHDDTRVLIPSHWRQSVRVGAMPVSEVPVWIACTAEAVMGLDGPESPLPGASDVGPRMFIEVRYEPKPKLTLEDLF